MLEGLARVLAPHLPTRQTRMREKPLPAASRAGPTTQWVLGLQPGAEGVVGMYALGNSLNQKG